MTNFRATVVLASLLALLTACQTERPYRSRTMATAQADSMTRMVADIDALRLFVRGEIDNAWAEEAATDLVQWAGRMGELFPPDTAPKLYPDMTAEMARNAPAAMRTTTEQLLAAVKTGDRREVRRRLSEVERDGCGLCHRSP